MIVKKILAICIIIIFYFAYFTKMIIQKKHGIKTDQMAKGTKPKKTFITELFLKIVTYSVVLVEVLSIFIYHKDLNLIQYIIGLIISSLGVLTFIVAMITMKDSWRAGIQSEEKTSLIKKGIYKVSRNPAFLDFDLMYIGLLIMFFNIVHLVFVLLAIILLHLQILEEEKFLINTFDDEYIDYKKKVNRYFGIKR